VAAEVPAGVGRDWVSYIVDGGLDAWKEETVLALVRLVEETNSASRQRVMSIHRNAREAQVKLIAGEGFAQELVTGRGIPVGTVIGYLPSDLHGESAGPSGSIPYRERVLGERLVLSAQFMPCPAAGYDDDGWISNLWFAGIDHFDACVGLYWEQVSGPRGGLLWLLTGRAVRNIAAHEKLTINPNEASGNIGAGGSGRFLQMPTGPQARLLCDMNLAAVETCGCNVDCTAIIIDEDARDQDVRAAREAAAIVGIRFIGKRKKPVIITLEEASRQMKLNRTARVGRQAPGNARTHGDWLVDEQAAMGTELLQQQRERQAASGVGPPRRKTRTRRHSDDDVGHGASAAGSQTSTGCARGGSGLQAGSISLAGMRHVIQGDHASGEAPSHSLSGLDPVRLGQIVTESEARHLLQHGFQNNPGARRWIHAVDPSSDARERHGFVDHQSGGLIVQFGSNDVGLGGQDSVALSRPVAGLRHVRDSSTRFDSRAPSEQGDGSGLGNATSHAGGIAVIDSVLHRGGTVASHLQRVASASQRTASISENDAGDLLTARRTAAAGHASDPLHDAKTDASGRAHSWAAARCDDDGDRDANVRSGGGGQAVAGVRLSARLRRGDLSTVPGLGSDAGMQTQARSPPARVISAFDERLSISTVHRPTNSQLDESAGVGGFCRMHKAAAPSGALSALSTPVSQFSSGRWTMGADVASADFLGRQESAGHGPQGRGSLLLDLDETRRHISGGARAGARTDPLSAKRARVGERSEDLHGAARSSRALPNGAGAPHLTSGSNTAKVTGPAAVTQLLQRLAEEDPRAARHRERAWIQMARTLHDEVRRCLDQGIFIIKDEISTTPGFQPLTNGSDDEPEVNAQPALRGTSAAAWRLQRSDLSEEGGMNRNPRASTTAGPAEDLDVFSSGIRSPRQFVYEQAETSALISMIPLEVARKPETLTYRLCVDGRGLNRRVTETVRNLVLDADTTEVSQLFVHTREDGDLEIGADAGGRRSTSLRQRSTFAQFMVPAGSVDFAALARREASSDDQLEHNHERSSPGQE